MPNFSRNSLKILDTCHKDLSLLFKEVVKEFDCTIISGFRTEEEQNNLFVGGFSKLKFPHSNHNKFPSKGVDVAPYPIDWENKNRFIYFGGYVLGIASKMKINVIVGFDWDGDFYLKDHLFLDYGHFELVE